MIAVQLDDGDHPFQIGIGVRGTFVKGLIPIGLQTQTDHLVILFRPQSCTIQGLLKECINAGG